MARTLAVISLSFIPAGHGRSLDKSNSISTFRLKRKERALSTHNSGYAVHRSAPRASPSGKSCYAKLQIDSFRYVLERSVLEPQYLTIMVPEVKS